MMPSVTVSLLEGYDDATRAELMEAIGAAIRTTLDAPADGIVVILNEMKPSNYRRGGIERRPRPLPPSPADLVRDYLAAMGRRDLDAARSFLAEGFVMI